MKRLININMLVALSLALASSFAYADFKIGLVDKQVLGQDSLYAKNVHEKMKKEFSARQEALIGKEKELMSKFVDNFKKFNVSDAVLQAGPRLD